MTSRLRTNTFTLVAAALMLSIPTEIFAFRACGSDPPEAESDATAGPATRSVSLPHNIVAPRMLKPLMLGMLRRSETFRRQCRLIAASPAAIEIRLVPKYVVGRDRALSTVKKYQFGFTTVLVQIAAPCNCAELIGHEFEHVIEQIEGIDLPDLAERKGAGVSVNDAGAYETDRARKAGRLVANESDETPRRTTRLPGVSKQ
ncbi:MAG TPA: hypothetical protein VFV34_04430 [Blastocatellia bacterium]|nr:hypothetical protein [Blastocatellia bacterium]